MADSDIPRAKLVLELEKTAEFQKLATDYKKSREAPIPTSAPVPEPKK